MSRTILFILVSASLFACSGTSEPADAKVSQDLAPLTKSDYDRADRDRNREVWSWHDFRREYRGYCRYDMATACTEYYTGNAAALEATCKSLAMPGNWSSTSYCPRQASTGGCWSGGNLTWHYPLGLALNGTIQQAMDATKLDCEAGGGEYVNP
jgi:hypothetical protein